MYDIIQSFCVGCGVTLIILAFFTEQTTAHIRAGHGFWRTSWKPLVITWAILAAFYLVV